MNPANEPATTRVVVTVRGRVQGVAFRAFVARRAGALGLCGTVRNLGDGAVEVEAEGPRVALEALVASVGRGPSGARVEGLDDAWSEGPPRHRDFRIAADA